MMKTILFLPFYLQNFKLLPLLLKFSVEVYPVEVLKLDQ